MSKTLMFAAVLLLSAAWLQAQQYPQSGSSPSGGTQASSGQGSDSSGKTTVEGCLQGSGGNFMLTDSSGVTYQLQGDTSKLTEHVGHEVQIKGTTSGSAGSSQSSGAAAGSSAGSQQTLNVDSVKHIAKTCKSAGK
jgi:Protein of unknown function (DUF5818)